MARPQPVIVPALKMDLQESQIDLGLGKLLPLLEQFVFKPKRERQEVLGLQKALPGLFKNLSFEEAKAAINSPLFQELAKTQIKQQFAEPKTAKDVGGFLRFLGGEQRGERVFPEVEKPEKEFAPQFKVAFDPASSTGFRYVNQLTGEKGSEAPKPSALVNIEMGKPPSPTERTAIATGAAAIDNLNNLKSLFDKSYVGPIKGRVSTVKEIFGGNPQEQSEFIAATAAFKNQIIKEITGAQMSEVEAKRIMKQVPDENNPPSVWQARWKQSIENIKRIQKRRAEVLRQSGLKVPLGEDIITQPQTADEYLKSIGQGVK